MCCKGFIKYDVIGIQPSLTIKGKGSHGTAVGGLISVIYLFMLFCFVMSQIYELIFSPQYVESTSSAYLKQTSEEVVYNISSSKFVMAVKLSDQNTGISIGTGNEYVKLQFYQASKTREGQVQYKFHDAIKCSEFFDVDDFHYSFRDELDSAEWICPKIEDFGLANNPFLFLDGTNLNFVVNYCAIADPSNSTCSTIEEANQYARNIRVDHKFLTQYFNPQYYTENKALEYVALNRMQLDLIPGITKATNFEVTRNNVWFFDGKIINIEADMLPMVNAGDEFHYYYPEAGQESEYELMQLNNTYGLYRASLSQGPKVYSQNWSVVTFNGYLAAIGGYSASLLGLMWLFMGNYQNYRYEQMLIQQLYTRDQMERPKHMQEEDHIEELSMNILNRVKQMMKFHDWMILQYGSFCKCLFSEKRKKANDAHNNASARLNREMDMLDLIESARVTKFIAQLSMKQSNRQLIKYFKPYHIVQDNLELPEKKPLLSVNQLLSNFNPGNNFIHRRILYEITGRKVEENDQYSDDEYDKFYANQAYAESSYQDASSQSKSVAMQSDNQSLFSAMRQRKPSLREEDNQSVSFHKTSRDVQSITPRDIVAMEKTKSYNPNSKQYAATRKQQTHQNSARINPRENEDDHYHNV